MESLDDNDLKISLFLTEACRAWSERNMPGHNSSVFRFSDVEVQEQELHIRRNGDVVPVEPKAFRVLIHLLRNPGRLVPKDELIKAGWGDTVVTDNSLTRNVALLRRLLADDPREPRYIETVSTVGYRFVAPVEVTEDASLQRQSESKEAEEDGRKTAARRSRVPITAAATAVAAVCAALLAAWWLIPRAVPVVDSITQLTDDPQQKSNLVTDGSRIYFNQGLEGSTTISEVSIEGGAPVVLKAAPVDLFITGAAQDGSALVGTVINNANPSAPLWSVSLPAGEPRRIDSISAQSAAFFPDHRILYSTGRDVLIAENNGSRPRKIASFAGTVGNLVVSPDGDHILLQADTRGDLKPDVFAMRADGTGLRQIRAANANECCFGWSRDGKYLVYSARTGHRWDLWALPVPDGRFGRPERAVRLTNGPVSFAEGAVGSRDGKHLFAIGSKERGQLVRYDMKARQFVPLLGGISATDATYSQDGKWVAYTMFPEHTLWRSRSDGSERMQLTFPPMQVWEPIISPDGTKVVFDSVAGGSVVSAGNQGLVSEILVIDVNGGAPRVVSASAWSPKWSPDGKLVAYNLLPPAGSFGQLEIAEIATGKKTEIPSPDGKLGAFWLDAQTIVAANGNLKKLMIFDFRTGKWTDLVAATLENWINSPDGKYVYYAAGGAESSIQRIRVADRRVETVTSLKDFTRVQNFGAPQLRMAADGSPTLTRAVDSEEVYAISVHWP